MSDRVSIIIPTFNRAGMLSRAIDSSLSQSVPSEVIVVEHGSTDETPAVAARYGDRISYVRRDRDFGPHFCWLDGVHHSSGDLVHLQFDDDWLKPQFLEKCLSVMTVETGFAFSAAEVKTDPESPPSMVLFEKWAKSTGTYPVKTFERRMLRTVVSPGACLFRRQTLIDALYQGNLPLSTNHYHGVGPDVFMSLLSMLRYPMIGFVKEPLSAFLSHEGSITIDAQKDDKKANDIKAAYKEARRFYRELRMLKRWRAIRGMVS
ncbi:MAG: glycosyltransferase family 2 protein [Silicimonas sp.]|nr:glycosyltransferase family 2 protein [Silicimonas sp.]